MYDIYKVDKTNQIIKMIKYFIFTDHIHVLVSSIINLNFNPKHTTLVRGINMDHLMPLRYLFHIYLRLNQGEWLCIGR